LTLQLRHPEGVGYEAEHAAGDQIARSNPDRLDQTLTEEKTDETLTKIAETAVNYEAAA
jgi:hypothetical protein